ncbi:MAG: hypothetical protein Q7S40_33510 [Opitutaceae bacterium]|nr:hypothetical protein [Opitutaceae bacterium]
MKTKAAVSTRKPSITVKDLKTRKNSTGGACGTVTVTVTSLNDPPTRRL